MRNDAKGLIRNHGCDQLSLSHKRAGSQVGNLACATRNRRQNSATLDFLFQ